MYLTGTARIDHGYASMHGTIKGAYGRCAFLLFRFHHAPTLTFSSSSFLSRGSTVPDRSSIDKKEI